MTQVVVIVSRHLGHGRIQVHRVRVHRMKGDVGISVDHSYEMTEFLFDPLWAIRQLQSNPRFDPSLLRWDRLNRPNPR